MKKKVLSVLLAAAMVFSLAACGGSDGGSTGGDNAGGDTQQEDNAGGDANVDDGAAGGEDGGATVSIPLDGTWPEETVKIGMCEYDTTSEQFQAIEAYYDYLSQYFNIELKYSESLGFAGPEAELQFIEDCYNAGCVAVIGRYNSTKEQAALAAAEHGMYYVGGFGGDSETYDKVKDNEYYLGSHTLGQADYEAGRALALKLAEDGKEKVVFVSGGADFVEQFKERKAGFEAGIEEAKANGSNIEVVNEVTGFPDDAWFAAQKAALDMDIDSIAAAFDPFMWFQPIAQAGKSDSVTMVCIGEVSDTYYEAFNNGQVTCIVYDAPDTVFGSPIAMILNAVTGNRLTNADGSAIYFPVERWTITDPADFNAIYDMHENSEYLISAEDMANLIVALNPDMNAEEFTKYYGSFTIDSVR